MYSSSKIVDKAANHQQQSESQISQQKITQRASSPEYNVNAFNTSLEDAMQSEMRVPKNENAFQKELKPRILE